jgi:hypothetical protein
MSQTKAQLIEGSAASELTAAKTLLGAGSAGAPSLTATGDTNTGIFFPTADTIAFAEGGVETVRIDSSGRVGIGTASPGSVCHVAGSNGDGLTVSGGGATGVFRSSAAGTELGSTSGDNTVFLSGSGTERMRITSAGDVCIKATAAFSSGSLNVLFDGTRNAICVKPETAVLNQNYAVFLNSAGSVAGLIQQTSSDYRLKENVTAVIDGITRLQQLKPSRFNFIADPNTVVDGFLAHEAQEVVPECVTGKKDAIDDKGNAVYQGIDQSKLVPLLTAALQEAIGRIETLEGRSSCSQRRVVPFTSAFLNGNF